MDQSAHVYCQIPFCRSRCPFCCYTASFTEDELTDLDLMPAYVEALIAEISAFPAIPVPLRSIVFGGGTPTLLEAGQLDRLCAQIRRTFPDRTSEGFTASFETTPELATPAKLDAFRAAGFNRVSIGVQALEDEDLALLGRCHRRADVLRSYRQCREAGFDNISFDLMMGFPGHTMARWQDTVREAIDLGPENVAINPLMTGFFGGDRYIDEWARRGHARPSFDQRAEMFAYAVRSLLAAGYERMLNFVFSRPGRAFVYERDAFSMRDNIIGFGAGSQSNLDRTVRIHYPIISEYIRDPSMNRLVIEYTDQVRHFFRMGLLFRGRVDDEGCHALLGTGLAEAILADGIARQLVEQMTRLNYAVFDDHAFSIREDRLPEALTYVWMFFDEHWE